jgi:hypothetical protein
VNRLLLRLLPALAGIALMIPAAIAADNDSPTLEPVLPDLDQEAPGELVLTKARGQWRLGFRSAVRNVGAGPLIIDGRRALAEQHLHRASAAAVLRRWSSIRAAISSG